MRSEDSTTPSAWSGWPRVATTAIAYASGATASGLLITYVVGFLVVNYYLASFGIRELDPVRPRYVAASVPFIALIALTVFVVFELERSSWRLVQRNRPKGKFRNWAAWTILVAIAAAADTALAVLLRSGSDGDVTAERVLTMIAFAAFVTVVFANARRLPAIAPRTWIFTNAYFALAAAVLAISVYATAIYPDLPTWIGGGKPDDVQLVVSSSIAVACPECASGAVVRLIDEESSRIIVLVGDPRAPRAVEISRTEVQAIVHRAKAPTR